MNPSSEAALSGKSSNASTWRPLPGDAAWWMFLTAEFATICIFCVTFAVMRAADPVGFAASQAHLDPTLAFTNTLILITSGWCAARGVLAIKGGRAKATSYWYGAALLLGVVFLFIKTSEYSAKSAEGISLGTDTFFFFYYFLTGFHYLHVMLGVVFLGYIIVKTSRGAIDEATVHNTESSAAFCHMLDLVWVILFPLLYLL